MNNQAQYREICARDAGVPLFLQPWWLDVACPQWDAAIALKGERVVGIWPYATEQKLGVRLLRTPLLTPYFGPHIFFPSDIKESNRDSFEHDIIEALLKQMPDAAVWSLSMPPGLKQAGLLKSKGLDIQVKQTFLIDLEPGEDILFGNLKDSIRRNIRSAAKEIAIVNDPACIGQLCEYQKATFTRKEVAQPYSLAYMKHLLNACVANNMGALWVAKKGSEIAAVVWNVWDAERSYYFMGAQNPASDNYTAMSALLWHSMLQAKERGNQSFDLEGSMDPGVEKFFRGFGGERELYLLLQKNESILWKIVRLLRR